MSRPKRPGTTYYGLDIDDDDFKFLSDTAVAEDRPLSRLVRRILREWVEEKRQERQAEARVAAPQEVSTEKRRMTPHLESLVKLLQGMKSEVPSETPESAVGSSVANFSRKKLSSGS